jgi:DNA polymerase-1
MKDVILLIDGLNAVWRASISFKKFSSEDQRFVLIYNFFRNLRPIVEMFAPNKIFFVLDGHPQFRHDLYAGYKANRIVKTASTKSKEVFKDLDLIVELLQLLPISIVKADNYEADDVISTLCNNMKSESLVILSNDSDYIQLLQNNYEDIKIYNPIKKELMSAPTYPYIVWKALRGDSSDNIQGLMSDKKAEKICLNPTLLKEFLSIEENRANFSINRSLIQFAEVPLEELNIIEGNKDFDSLKIKFDEMKFISITNDKSWEKYVRTFDCVNYG